MKLLLSPSKTQDFNPIDTTLTLTTPKFIDNTHDLVEQLRKYSKEALSKHLEIKGQLLDEAYQMYQDFHLNTPKHSIYSYTGTVFKGLNLNNYTKDDIQFMNNHLVILSALYGVLTPTDGIKPYRLDMTMNTLNLCQYWNHIKEEFKDEEVIINLASEEFSKLISFPMITIYFLENKNGTYKNISTYSKIARGIMTNYIITYKITSVTDLKQFNLNHYNYNELLSSKDKLVFTR